MTITEAQAEAAALGVCWECDSLGVHAEHCPVPHVGWASGQERCCGCRRLLDVGEAYTLTAVEQRGGFEVGELTCLVCACGEGAA